MTNSTPKTPNCDDTQFKWFKIGFLVQATPGVKYSDELIRDLYEEALKELDCAKA